MRQHIGDALSRPQRNHVDAIAIAKGVHLTCGVDNNLALIARYGQDPRFAKARLVSSTEDMPTSTDIISICTPTATREQVFHEALLLQPKVIIVEKPLANDGVTARRLMHLAVASGVQIVVNFQRRRDPALKRVRSSITKNPEKVVFRYSNGMKNYASHAVDLLIGWFGKINKVQAFGTCDEGDDPNYSFVCSMDAGFQAIFLGIDRLQYDQFEFDLFFEDKVVGLHNSGVEKVCQLPVEGLYVPHYRQLGPCNAIEPLGGIGGLVELYQDVTLTLKGSSDTFKSEIYETLHGIDVLDAVEKSLANGNVNVAVDSSLKPNALMRTV